MSSEPTSPASAETVDDKEALHSHPARLSLNVDTTGLRRKQGIKTVNGDDISDEINFDAEADGEDEGGEGDTAEDADEADKEETVSLADSSGSSPTKLADQVLMAAATSGTTTATSRRNSRISPSQFFPPTIEAEDIAAQLRSPGIVSAHMDKQQPYFSFQLSQHQHSKTSATNLPAAAQRGADESDSTKTSRSSSESSLLIVFDANRPSLSESTGENDAENDEDEYDDDDDEDDEDDGEDDEREEGGKEDDEADNEPADDGSDKNAINAHVHKYQANHQLSISTSHASQQQQEGKRRRKKGAKKKRKSSDSPSDELDPSDMERLLLARLEAQNSLLYNDPKAAPIELLRQRVLQSQSQQQADGSKGSSGSSAEVAGGGGPFPSSSSSSSATAVQESSPSLSATPAGGAGSGPSSGPASSRLYPLSGLPAFFSSVYQSATRTSEGPDEEVGNVETTDWDFWGKVISDYDEVARKQSRLLQKKIRSTGIPPALRGQVWQLLSRSKDAELESNYNTYLKQTSSYEKMISRDLARTFPKHPFFSSAGGLGQESLYNVVKAYSLHDKEVGYCQGVSFIAGALLLNMPDEEAFCVLVKLMEHVGMRLMFTPTMEGLQLKLFQFDALLVDLMPVLNSHLDVQGIKSTMYASQWFLTLFAYRFPLLTHLMKDNLCSNINATVDDELNKDLVFRIMDVILAESSLDILFRVAFALLKRNEPKLLSLDFERLLDFLKNGLHEVYGVDGNMLICEAMEVKIQSRRLEKLTRDYGDMVRREAESVNEVDQMRDSLRRLEGKLADTENRMACSDKEKQHLQERLAAMAAESTKLQEENEALQRQVRDLKMILVSEEAKGSDVANNVLDVQQVESLRRQVETLKQENAAIETRANDAESALIATKLALAESELARESVQKQLDLMRRAGSNASSASSGPSTTGR